MGNVPLVALVRRVRRGAPAGTDFFELPRALNSALAGMFVLEEWLARTLNVSCGSSFLVRAVIPNPKRELRPGMFVTAKVHGFTRPDAIVVPQLVVQQGAKGHVVYVVKPDGVAELRPVVVGDYQGEKDIVVVSGLQSGDRVVVEGAMKVVPGKPVQIGVPGVSATSKADLPAEKK